MEHLTMKQLLECVESRHNAVAFLHFSDIILLNEMLGVDVNKKSFNEVVALIKESAVNTKVKRKALALVLKENGLIRTERFRFENGKVFEYSEDQNAYLFIGIMSRIEFNKTMNQKGKYID